MWFWREDNDGFFRFFDNDFLWIEVSFRWFSEDANGLIIIVIAEGDWLFSFNEESTIKFIDGIISTIS